ncbi:MAG: HAD hydrolase family protein [Dorea sp.]|nr:HAD hydrolase family protein [Dorea sp.]
MKVIHLDLDNTLIYSYKHAIGEQKINVELYQGREISYMTEEAHGLLRQINQECLIVPTTTRTKEQYERIDLKAGAFEYALICNGGLLLVNGKSDPAWYAASRELTADCAGELQQAIQLLDKEPLRKFEIRFIEELFVFTKCSQPERVVLSLKKELDHTLTDVFCNGEKVYVVPKRLNKGTAVRRFRDYVRADIVLAAGDSEFDLSMVEEADIGIVPAGFCKKYRTGGGLKEMKGESVFSDEMLLWMKNLIYSN